MRAMEIIPLFIVFVFCWIILGVIFYGIIGTRYNVSASDSRGIYVSVTMSFVAALCLFFILGSVTIL